MRQIGRLSALSVTNTKQPGMYPDGAGLYLQVSGSGTKSWIYRYMLHGKAREMGLGPAHTIGLADARQRAAEARRLRLDGVDPIDHRHKQREAAKIEAAKAIAFSDCAARCVEAHAAGWRNAKHAAQWTSTIETYCAPVMGKLAVQAVDVGHVMKVLEPIWTTKPETASRVRGRIETVLDWAAARAIA